MQDDEVLEEIKKCVQELTTVNEYNKQGTNELKKMTENDLKISVLKDSLDQVDLQVKLYLLCSLYSLLLVVTLNIEDPNFFQGT